MLVRYTFVSVEVVLMSEVALQLMSRWRRSSVKS